MDARGRRDHLPLPAGLPVQRGRARHTRADPDPGRRCAVARRSHRDQRQAGLLPRGRIPRALRCAERGAGRPGAGGGRPDRPRPRGVRRLHPEQLVGVAQHLPACHRAQGHAGRGGDRGGPRLGRGQGGHALQPQVRVRSDPHRRDHDQWRPDTAGEPQVRRDAVAELGIPVRRAGPGGGRGRPGDRCAVQPGGRLRRGLDGGPARALSRPRRLWLEGPLPKSQPGARREPHVRGLAAGRIKRRPRARRRRGDRAPALAIRRGSWGRGGRVGRRRGPAGGRHPEERPAVCLDAWSPRPLQHRPAGGRLHGLRHGEGLLPDRSARPSRHRWRRSHPGLRRLAAPRPRGLPHHPQGHRRAARRADHHRGRAEAAGGVPRPPHLLHRARPQGDRRGGAGARRLCVQGQLRRRRARRAPPR